MPKDFKPGSGTISTGEGRHRRLMPATDILQTLKETFLDLDLHAMREALPERRWPAWRERA